MTAIAITMYDTRTLLGVLRQMQPPTSYWRDLCFPNQANFETEYVDFEKIGDVRRIAPLVMPMSQGVPIYSEGSTVTRMRPAYVKPKDAVNPSRVIKRRPGELGDYTDGNAVSPMARYNAIIADILRVHREAIERRWEWLASQAVINGAVTLQDDNYPIRTVDFGRDSGQTIVLTGAATWDNTTTVDPLSDILTWKELARRALFGGITNRLTVGATAWEYLRKNEEVRQLLRYGLDKYSGGLDPNLGLRQGELIEYVGKLSNNLEVWVYSDYYQDPVTGTQTPFMSDTTAVLTGPNLMGYACFGAILDPHAQFQPLAMFPRMFMENDPGVTFVMTQSAPLYVPVNPNCSVSATIA